MVRLSGSPFAWGPRQVSAAIQLFSLGIVAVLAVSFGFFAGFPFVDGMAFPEIVGVAARWTTGLTVFWAIVSVVTLFGRQSAVLESRALLVATVFGHAFTHGLAGNLMGTVTGSAGVLAIAAVLVGLAILPRGLFWLGLFATLITNSIVHYLNVSGALPFRPLFEQNLFTIGLEAEVSRLMFATALVYVPVVLLADRFIRGWRLDEDRLHHYAHVDGLTGAHSRRHTLALLGRLVRKRSEEPHAVLMVDVDHFKQINDEFGHAAGDEVLVNTVAVVRDALRGDDVVGRIGGEEFLVVLPGADLQQALAVAERCRQAIAQVRVPGSEEHFVTASVGAASFPEHGQRTEPLLAAADLALYRAKAKGRNRVESAVC